MEMIKSVVSWALVLLSAYMVFDGALMFLGTSGQVQGSEFGMLITLVNQISLVMLWLALFAMRAFLSDSVLRRKQASEA